MSETTPDSRMNSSVQWPDESLPLEIYCSTGVLTELETLATDGLRAMPRTGLGIGGLLLGRHSGERLEILKTVAISCSHAMGPSFVLTPEEIAEAKAPEDGADGAFALVGWYCSKPNGQMALSESDRALFDALCSDRGQVLLLIRPRLGYVTMAGFVIRGDGQNGDAFRLGAQSELVTPERIVVPEFGRAEEYRLPPVEPEPEAAATPKAPAQREPETPEPIPDPRPAAAMPYRGTLFGVSMAEPQQRPIQKRRWPLRLLLAVILLAILAAAAYLTSNYWLPVLQADFASYLPARGISK